MPKCKGLIFRCYMSAYRTSRGEYVEQRKMSPLKLKSCKGCSECSYLTELMDEDIADDISLFEDIPINGQLYEYKVIYESTDHETWMIDTLETGFVRV